MRKFLISALLFIAVSSVYAGDCTLIGTICAEGPATRIVSGVSVYRDCWRYESEYECLSPNTTEQPGCADLRARGCSQNNSTCIDFAGTTCALYEQTYDCPSTLPPAQQQVLDCSGQVMCVDGGCFDSSYTPSPDMGKALASLAVVDAVAKDLAEFGNEIFKGADRRCGVSLFDKIGAHNCCALSGWATGTLQCSFEEELLAEQRNASACHKIGTYCSSRTFAKTCLVDTQTYCCFSSKLARIIAEQGRLQLNIDWGTATAPNCAGFTLDQVATLDFEAMDLSEFYADVMASMPALSQPDTQQRMNDRIQQLLQ